MTLQRHTNAACWLFHAMSITVIAAKINTEVPESYMVRPARIRPLLGTEILLRYQDEIFHVSQAQMYCRGRWDVWESKLTTPPGLCVQSPFVRPLMLKQVKNLATFLHLFFRTISSFLCAPSLLFVA